MPYKIRESDDGKKFTVINSDTGKEFGEHSSKKDAVKQMQAMYANVKDSKKSSDFSKLSQNIKSRVAELKGGPGSGPHPSSASAQNQYNADRAARNQASEFAQAAQREGDRLGNEAQRSHASADAYSASERAFRTGDPVDHRAAAIAHENAAKLYQDAKDSGMHSSGTATNPGAGLNYHLTYAESHRAKS